MAWFGNLLHRSLSPDLERGLHIEIDGRPQTRFTFWRDYWEPEHERATQPTCKARRVKWASPLSTSVQFLPNTSSCGADLQDNHEVEDACNTQSADKWSFALDGQGGSWEGDHSTSSSRRVSDAGGYNTAAGSLLVEVKITKSIHQHAQEKGHNGKLVIMFYSDGEPCCNNTRNSATHTGDSTSANSATPPAPASTTAPGLQRKGSDDSMCQQLNVAPTGKPLIRLFRYSDNPETESRGLFISMAGKVMLTDTDFGEIEELEPDGENNTESSQGCDRCLVMEQPWSPAKCNLPANEVVSSNGEEEGPHEVTEAEDLAARKAAEDRKFGDDGRE